MKTRVLDRPQYADYDLSGRRPFALRPREEDAIRAWQVLTQHCDTCKSPCWGYGREGRRSSFRVGCPEGRALYLAAWRAGRLWDAERRLLEWGAQQQEPPSGMMSAYAAAYALRPLRGSGRTKP